MANRTQRLAQELIRKAALNLPESTFLGWRHFVHELNQFVNKHVRNKPDDNLTFVTIQTPIEKNHAILDLYVGEPEEYGIDPKKLVTAVQYFVREMDMKMDSVERRPDEPDNILVSVSGLSRFEEPSHYKNIKNLWMKNALMVGDAIDVRTTGVEVEDGVFKLNEFVPGIKYVDSENEQFIQSIGKDRSSGEMLASLDTRFYEDPEYECVYLA
jgi:hypothetical protein